MKGICFYSIAYLILVNPYLLSTAANQCISKIDLDDEYSFSIAKLPSSSMKVDEEDEEENDQIISMNHDDNENISTLYQIAATKACYESCNSSSKKTQIMSFSTGFIQSKTSPLTILDHHHTKLFNLQFLKPNEIYLVVKKRKITMFLKRNNNNNMN